ncbi:hypothetical protein [Spirosoma agri]|uniref:SD-repeat containing protein B domain-containing protein n=1 Tax=Spirosoma agri TaxID=1987381 RepID=A0A6M0IBU5_9BACT|nr:hypothetical protein [Spirosoma agri]NEU65538.1 hypothetical protein [Spirosoma agri]
MAQSINTTLWRDSIVTSPGTTFTNYITIANTGSQQQDLALALQVSPSIQMLSAIPEKLALTPGEVVMVPVKGLINRESNSLANQVTVQLRNSSGDFSKTVAFRLITKEKRQSAVSLYAPEETIVTYADIDPVQLPLRIVHNRLKRANFTIEVSSIPQEVDQPTFPLKIDLLAQQDTTLSMLVKPARHWSVSTPCQLIVTVRDETESIVGTVLYKLVVATSDKRFITRDVFGRSGYGVSAAITKLSNNQLAKEMRVWGQDSVGKGQVEFQVHYLDYSSGQFQQLQNSFITYRTEHAFVRLGSSFDYHELPLFGKGLKVNVTQPNYQWTVWAINSQPNWLVNDPNAWSGNIFSVRYDRQLIKLPGASWSWSSNYFTQPTTLRAGYLNFAAFRLNRSERHSVEMLGGHSVEYARSGANRAETYGWAGLLNYTYTGSALSWVLRSYVSSPLYTGFQKGATLVNSQLIWQVSAKTILAAHLNHVYYKQVRFTSPSDTYRSEFGNTIAEVSLNQQLGALKFTLRPYWYAQTDLAAPVSQRADAYRIAPSLFYTHNNQRFELNYDLGSLVDRSHSAQPRLLSQRIMGSVLTRSFSLLAYLQKGPYFLFDLSSVDPAQLTSVSITPMVNFDLLNRRLAGSVGVNYLSDARNNGVRYIAVGRVQFDATPTLSMRLEGNATPYSQRPELAFSQYRLDVTKRFSQLKLGNRGKLNLTFFEDSNSNGLKDPTERWMDSLLVTVNENVLMTNAKGNIIYRNIQPGTYTVSAISAGRIGDPVLYQEKFTITGSFTKQIPLARTFRIKGQLQCKTNAYDQVCQFNRFSIDIERNQQVISSTSPLPDGSFSVHLQPGTYTLLVRDYGRQPQAIVKTTSFTVSETGQYPALDWTIDGSTRPVEIKRFSSKR